VKLREALQTFQGLEVERLDVLTAQFRRTAVKVLRGGGIPICGGTVACGGFHILRRIGSERRRRSARWRSTAACLSFVPALEGIVMFPSVLPRKRLSMVSERRCEEKQSGDGDDAQHCSQS